MSWRTVAAVDLGAESGRVLGCYFDGGRLVHDVAHRFSNAARPVQGFLRWDAERLWTDVQEGLGRLGRIAGRVDSVGVAAWGLDYALVDGTGNLVDDPISYRDSRTAGRLDEVIARLGAEELYNATGTQLMSINTIVQLFTDVCFGLDRLDRATRILMIPDLFHYWLSGVPVTEFTAATTTGAYDVGGRHWAVNLLASLGIRTDLFTEVVEPGTELGPLRAIDHSVFDRAVVVPPGSHDTASAIAGIPFDHPGAAFISSGTWSLVGVETSAPVIGPSSRAANLSNEGGVFGTNRLLRNVAGLWLIQQCRRQWSREGVELSYSEIVRRAEQAEPARCFVDVDRAEFLTPGDIPSRIRDFCRRTGQVEPHAVGDVARCVFESLALRYRATIEALEEVVGHSVPYVHIVGGGARNTLLNQITADVTGLPVHAGPVEATAIGNAIVQLVAQGHIDGLVAGRDIVRASERITMHRPRPDCDWDEIYREFCGWAADDHEDSATRG